MPKEEVSCSQCKKSILRSPSSIKPGKNNFCSQACKQRWQRENKINQDLKKRVVVKCNQCGADIERIPSHIREINFCSRACFAQWKSKNWRAENSPFWKGGKIKIICDVCGKPFERSRAEADKREKHFCGHECFSVWKSQQTGEKAGKWNGGMVTISCSFCGKPVSRVQSVVKNRSEHFFCNRFCHGQWKSHYLNGPNHPLWRGGWQPYYGPSWKYQRRNARKRDNFTCQHCGMTEARSIEVFNQKLHVHHVKPFMEFVYIEGQNDNDKQANSLQNLITLCQSCHYKVEWEYRQSLNLPPL